MCKGGDGRSGEGIGNLLFRGAAAGGGRDLRTGGRGRGGGLAGWGAAGDAGHGAKGLRCLRRARRELSEA